MTRQTGKRHSGNIKTSGSGQLFDHLVFTPNCKVGDRSLVGVASWSLFLISGLIVKRGSLDIYNKIVSIVDNANFLFCNLGVLQ